MQVKRVLAGALAVLMVLTTVLVIQPSVTASADSTEPSSSVDLTEGLIGYYTFNNTLENSAGSGSASLHGGAGDTWNMDATGSAAYEEGVNESAYSFAGDGEVRGEGLELDVTMPESAYTISFWVNPDTVSSATSMVFSPYDLDAGLNIADNWFGSTFPTVRLWDSTSGDKRVASDNIYLDNWISSADALCGQWTYITLSCDSDGSMTLYINGNSVQTGTGAIAGGLAGQPLYLGINFWDSSFDGRMDDVAIYDLSLSADAVKSLYANKGVPMSSVDEVVSTTHVSVHDPSIVKDTQGTSESTYYIFGSHMAWAKSDDLIHWESFTNNINTDYKTIFAEPAKWAAQGGTQGDSSGSYNVGGNLWAPDVIWNDTMKKWCMYMSVNGDYWYSSIVLLTADTLDGDWKYEGIVTQSGLVNGAVTFDYEKVMGTTTIADRYRQKSGGGNALYETNCIDPCVTYDEDGKLWMSWGSWFGGIWMIELDEETGLRDYSVTYDLSAGDATTLTSDPYSGYRLAGGTNVSGEASYIEHIGDYYYLYVTYGGLTATGGYNMRVFRSKSITGPYKDESGDDARYDVSNKAGSINGSVGNRVMSYYQWSYMSYGFAAQGHNSAYYDAELDKSFVVYHTRFNLGGEAHEVRVHQTFVNEDGWLVTAPFEYTGETLTDQVTADDVVGTYEVLFHRLDIDYTNLDVATGVNLSFNEDGTVSGDREGTWEFGRDGAPYVTVIIDGTTYKGVFLYQQMEDATDSTWTFTLLGTDEISVWGYRYVGEDAKLAQQAADNLTMPEGTFIDLNLPSQGINTSEITWNSSNEEVIASDGTITVPDEDTMVTLTATFTVGEASVTKNFDIIVYSPQSSKENKVLRTYLADEMIDLTDVSSSSYRFMNPFNEATTNGIELYSGVSINFTVTPTPGADQWLTDIISFNAGSNGNALFFEGNSYLGYNATGGYFDANVQNGDSWAWGTDFIGGSSATVEIRILPTGYEVYVNDELKYDQSDVDSGRIKGNNSMDTYASVLDFLENTASYMDFGWGSWWAGGYKGTVGNVVLSVLPLNEKTEVSDCYLYYEDFSTLAGTTGSDTGWTSPNAANYLSVTSTDDYYLNFANSGASGNRSAYKLFDESAQVSGTYTVELDAALTAGILTQRSVSELAILGTDAIYSANGVVSSGYILKLTNEPPEGTAANQANDTQQDQWIINDSDTVITIPVGAWVHILAEVNTAEGNVSITVTNNETGEVICENIVVEISGTGTVGGLYLLNGRGIGTSAVDNIAVIQHNYVADVTEATCTTDGYTTYTCSRCGDSYTVAGDRAIGHDWNYDNLTWTWSDDGKSATVTYYCKNDGTHYETVDAKVEVSEITAVSATENEVTYKASITLEGTEYTDIKVLSESLQEKVEDTDNTQSTNSGEESTTTGDSDWVILWMLVCISAAGCLTTATLSYRRNH